MSLEVRAVRTLVERGCDITTAESCTGGLVAAALIDVPGASKVYKEGYITYSNEAKEKLLHVSHRTLQNFGAVSPETAKEMAEGCRKAAGSDIGVGITGVAGPDGGTKDKPVGLVYIGCCCMGNTYVKEFRFRGNRSRVRESSVAQALNLLRSAILEETGK